MGLHIQYITFILSCLPQRIDSSRATSAGEVSSSIGAPVLSQLACVGNEEGLLDCKVSSLSSPSSSLPCMSSQVAGVVCEGECTNIHSHSQRYFSHNIKENAEIIRDFNPTLLPEYCGFFFISRCVYAAPTLGEVSVIKQKW